MATGSEPLRRLEATIHANGGPGIPDGGVLVEIESFFDGNTDESSIAPNLVDDTTNPVMQHPGLDVIRDRLLWIRDRPEVADVLVDVMVEWEHYPEGDWPYAQAIQVVTTASPTTVDSWLEGMNTDPSFTTAGSDDAWVNPPEVPDGYQIVTIWWD